MYKALSPGAVGVSAGNLDARIQAAQIGGFGGVEIDPSEIAGLVETQGRSAVVDKFAGAGIKPAAFGLPVEWRGSEDAWRASLNDLPRLAEAAAAIGVTRTMTWIMPCSDDLEFAENKEFHITRFTPVAAILADHGLSLGLEFIGPKTLRDTQKFPFIHTMEGMLEMGREIGPNVGLLLDCWHWYTSHGTLEQLRALTPAEVVVVHVNDAPVGVAVDDQMDSVRDLPGATGVVDIAGFLQSLQAIGCDAPVIPEPFVDMKGMPSDTARLERVGAAMNDIWRKAGLR